VLDVLEVLRVEERQVDTEAEVGVAGVALAVGAGAATVWMVFLNVLCMALVCVVAFMLARSDRD
jgi:hypothetical protein